MDVYAQAQIPAKRKARQKVVEVMRPEERQQVPAVGTKLVPKLVPGEKG